MVSDNIILNPTQQQPLKTGRKIRMEEMGEGLTQYSTAQPRAIGKTRSLQESHLTRDTGPGG